METLEIKKPTVDIKKATFDDIVFENRNKTYGGYDLRKRYGKTILLAFLIASVTLTSIFLIRLYLQTLEEPVVIKPEVKKEIVIEDIPVEINTPKPPPLPQIEMPKIETVKFVPIEVAKTEQEVKQEKVATQKELENTTAGTQDQKGVKDTSGTMSLNTSGPGKLGGVPDGQEEDAIWIGPVTKNASFPGGHAAFNKYINEHITERLQEYIRDRGVKGKMFVLITVGTDGSIIESKVVRGMPLCKLCDEEIPDVIFKGPKWEPGENNGRPVKLRFSIPIVF